MSVLGTDHPECRANDDNNWCKCEEGKSSVKQALGFKPYPVSVAVRDYMEMEIYDKLSRLAPMLVGCWTTTPNEQTNSGTARFIPKWKAVRHIHTFNTGVARSVLHKNLGFVRSAQVLAGGLKLGVPRSAAKALRLNTAAKRHRLKWIMKDREEDRAVKTTRRAADAAISGVRFVDAHKRVDHSRKSLLVTTGLAAVSKRAEKIARKAVAMKKKIARTKKKEMRAKMSGPDEDYASGAFIYDGLEDDGFVADDDDADVEMDDDDVTMSHMDDDDVSMGHIYKTKRSKRRDYSRYYD